MRLTGMQDHEQRIEMPDMSENRAFESAMCILCTKEPCVCFDMLEDTWIEDDGGLTLAECSEFQF
jgi:hypothetical protein